MSGSVLPALLLYHCTQQRQRLAMQNVTVKQIVTVRGMASVTANVIVNALVLVLSGSHDDYHGFVHLGCCVLGAWGNVTLIVSANGGVGVLKNKKLHRLACYAEVLPYI